MPSNVDHLAGYIILFEDISNALANLTAKDGDCTSVFDEQCVSDLEQQIRDSTTVLLLSQSASSPDVCSLLSQSLTKLLPSCSKWSWLNSGLGSTG